MDLIHSVANVFERAGFYCEGVGSEKIPTMVNCYLSPLQKEIAGTFDVNIFPSYIELNPCEKGDKCRIPRFRNIAINATRPIYTEFKLPSHHTDRRTIDFPSKQVMHFSFRRIYGVIARIIYSHGSGMKQRHMSIDFSQDDEVRG